MKDPRGFTLLELLMVVIIIAILASIALPQYLRVAERSRAAEALTVLAAIRSSELRYKSSEPSGLYTTTFTDLDTDIPGFGVLAGAKSQNWDFSVDNTGAGAHAVATRITGTYSGNTIFINLDDGRSCANVDVWGLSPTLC